MTLKELLDRCDFKEIAPLIAQIFPDQAKMLKDYKEVFDILRNMEPKLNPDHNIDVIRIEECDGWCEKYISVSSCEGDYWESSLAKEIIVSDELTLTDNEIAARCLWSLTFYGFRQDIEEGRKESFNRIMGNIDTSNPYAVAIENLEDKMSKNYLPKQCRYAKDYSDSQECLTGKNGKPTQFFKFIPLKTIKRKKRKNRPKRMRDHRQRQRIEVLERMVKIESSILRLTANTKSFTRAELKYLFNTKLIFEDTYQSHSNNINQRIDYLIDLLSNYETEDFSKYTHFFLMFKTSLAYPLNQNELDKIQDYFNHRLPSTAIIRYGYGINENLDTEASLLFLSSY